MGAKGAVAVPLVLELVNSKTGAAGGGSVVRDLAKKLGMPPADGAGGSGPGTRENPGGTLEVGTFGSGVGMRMGSPGTSSVDETTEVSARLETDSGSDAGEDNLNRGKGNDFVGTSSIPSTPVAFYERNNTKLIYGCFLFFLKKKGALTFFANEKSVGSSAAGAFLAPSLSISRLF